jgi:hypothetical protein
VIRRYRERLEPECWDRHRGIHERPTRTTIHASSYDEWSISTIRDEDLISISIAYGRVLSRHHIGRPGSGRTSCRSFIHCSYSEFWTVIGVPSDICDREGLTGIDREIIVIVRSDSWWIYGRVRSSIRCGTECSIYRDCSLLCDDDIPTAIDSEWRRRTREYWRSSHHSRDPDSRDIIHS